MQDDTNLYLRNIVRQLMEKILACYRGWWQWHCICKTKGMRNTAIILIPDDDSEIAFFALSHLDQMLNRRKYNNAIIVSTNNVILKSAKYFSNNILAIKEIEEKAKNDLIQFACLYQFDERFICASIRLPLGRNGERLINRRGISKEEIFAVGVYGLYPYEQAECPIHKGEDPEIIAFMKGAGKNGA